MSSDDREDLLARLLTEALERQERGLAIDVAELCKDQPHLRAAVAAALRDAGMLSSLHGASAAVDPLEQTVLANRYRLQTRIGAGAMGAVYDAVDQELGRSVAVKILRPELVVGQKLDNRLAREGEVLARIKHRNVLTVFDRGQAHDDRTFLVMELLDGCSGAELLEDSAPHGAAPGPNRVQDFAAVLGDAAIPSDSDVRTVVSWMIDAADGLHAAHQQGIVHRDVKPSNLFFERSGRVVVVDFGIVSIGSHLTLGADGSPLGTPAFMAPEQLDSSNEPDPRTDVYGLSATLYHFLTGSPPFSGTAQQVLTRLSHTEPVRADLVRPGLPKDLVAIVEKGMSREIERRYATCAELGDDLRNWMQHRPVSARRTSRWGRTWQRLRRSWFARGVAAALLVVATTYAVLSWREARLAARLDAWIQHARVAPPALVAGLGSLRRSSATTDSERVRKTIDGMVELGIAPGISLGLRAILRSDGEDFAGAARDMERLAAAVDSPFARIAAETYRHNELPDAAAMPEPDSAQGSLDDRAVRLLHAIRGGSLDRSWLQRPVEQAPRNAHPGFAELELVARLVLTPTLPAPDRLAEYSAIEAATERLEGLRGGRSAITSYLLASVLNTQGRSRDALEVAAEWSELLPEDFLLRNLYGTTSLDCHEYELAREQLATAIRLQPQSEYAHSRLFLCLLNLEDFDEAEQVLRSTPFRDNARGRFLKARSTGQLLASKSVRSREHKPSAHQPSAHKPSPGDPSAAELLAAAQQVFAQLPRLKSGRTIEEIGCDIERAPSPELTAELLAAWARAPLDPRALKQVSIFLEPPLDEQLVDALCRVLRLQADTLRTTKR